VFLKQSSVFWVVPLAIRTVIFYHKACCQRLYGTLLFRLISNFNLRYTKKAKSHANAHTNLAPKNNAIAILHNA
jgi:hypothetical protein